jgi:glycerol-3-phosphate dehydrogenase (NAD(P)+)
MERFGRLFGADERTFLGLSGVGDLFLTATSELSRNYRVGVGLGQGKKIEVILEELGEVAEGVPTATAINAICNEQNVYSPIAKEVVELVKGKDAIACLHTLLNANQSYREF